MKRRGAACRYLFLAGRNPFPATPPPGRTRPVRPGPAPAHPGAEEATHMTGEDVMVSSSEAEQLRRQLLQAQKLSSVGALASSVAHEFNNILTTIINYARLALRTPADDAGRTQALEKILKGSQRAATIVSSMLGFARNQSTQREHTDLAA